MEGRQERTERTLTLLKSEWPRTRLRIKRRKDRKTSLSTDSDIHGKWQCEKIKLEPILESECESTYGLYSILLNRNEIEETCWMKPAIRKQWQNLRKEAQGIENKLVIWNVILKLETVLLAHSVKQRKKKKWKMLIEEAQGNENKK